MYISWIYEHINISSKRSTSKNSIKEWIHGKCEYWNGVEIWNVAKIINGLVLPININLNGEWIPK